MALLLKLLPYIAIIVIIGGSYTVGHVRGNAECQVKNSALQTSSIQKDETSHDKIEFKNSQLADPAVDAAISKFVRPE
jgi:hypothetical protein